MGPILLLFVFQDAAKGSNVPGLWGLDRVGARTEGTGNGTGVKVFIVDTGIYDRHEEFHQGKDPWAYISHGLTGTGKVDKDGHGTHMAGIVAGKTTGVAPGAEVHMVKGCNASDCCRLSDLIDSVTWVCGQKYMHLQDVTGLARPKVQRSDCTLSRIIFVMLEF